VAAVVIVGVQPGDELVAAFSVAAVKPGETVVDAVQLELDAYPATGQRLGLGDCCACVGTSLDSPHAVPQQPAAAGRLVGWSKFWVGCPSGPNRAGGWRSCGRCRAANRVQAQASDVCGPANINRLLRALSIGS